jgi:amidase
MPACHGFVIAEKSIEELQEYMSFGNLTSVQLTSCYLQRVYQTREYLK